MKSRIQFFELEDLPQFPRIIRSFMVECLEHIGSTLRIYDPVVNKLSDFLCSVEKDTIFDLCSGSGGPWKILAPELRKLGFFSKVHLSDKYPQFESWKRMASTDSSISFVAAPVDVAQPPTDILAVRTLFTCFHHFNPAAAKDILANAVQSQVPIAIFEFTQRSYRAILWMLLTPLSVCLLTPSIRPFRWSRLLWTYPIPVVPFALMFDGIVSVLRSYTPEELKKLTEEADPNGIYDWEISVMKGRYPSKITYLLGKPKPVD